MPDPSMLLHSLREGCFAGASLGCIYLAIVSILILGFRHGSPTDIDAADAARHSGCGIRELSAVTILIPLSGSEPRLFDRLACFCLQRYPGSIQLLCGAGGPSDMATATIERLRAAFPEKIIELKIDPREHGPNRKISNLANMVPSAQSEVIVAADSDIEVDPDYLMRVVSRLQKSGVGAVSCLYHGIAGGGVWSQLSALAINGHFLPQVVLALSFGLGVPCFGATIAMRRRTLAQLGGFAPFANVLADDFAIGQAVRACGYKVAIPHRSVGHVCFEYDLRSLLVRLIRFARTIKSIDPVGYAGTIVTHPFPLALLGVLAGDLNCVTLAAAALICRMMACFSIEKTFGLKWQSYWLVPICDLAVFAVYVVSFFGATVGWRGNRYRVLADGGLAQIEEQEPPVPGNRS